MSIPEGTFSGLFPQFNGLPPQARTPEAAEAAFQNVVPVIRNIASTYMPGKLTCENILFTATIDPRATHMITIQQKNHVEQMHYWLVKDYDWNIDTCLKILAIASIILSWGIAYFLSLAAAMIMDCTSPAPMKVELL